MRSYAHWTPRYIVNRLAWWGYERRNMDKPWLTPQATRFLATMLLPTDVGLEWGSGRSTVWFAKRLRQLTSVESDPEWYNRVKEQLAGAGVANVTYLHRSPESPAEPRDSEYVRVCDQFADASLGFALVDGMAREYCAASIMPKIAPGGLLVIDNCNKYLDYPTHSPASRFGAGHRNAEWARVAERLKSWRMIWTSSGVTDTGIWIRPA